MDVCWEPWSLPTLRVSPSLSPPHELLSSLLLPLGQQAVHRDGASRVVSGCSDGLQGESWWHVPFLPQCWG